jgi:uncharacterized damage-inducible protein DinB
MSGAEKPRLLQDVTVSSLNDASDKILQLAEAFSEEQYAWTPMAGVVSVKGAIIHVAEAYYFIATKLGSPPAGDVDLKKSGKDADKAATIAILKAARAHMIDAISKVPTDQLAEEIELFGSKAPRARLVLIAADHTHEHLGQLIAYARMNKVVPPWSK